MKRLAAILAAAALAAPAWLHRRGPLRRARPSSPRTARPTRARSRCSSTAVRRQAPHRLVAGTTQDRSRTSCSTRSASSTASTRSAASTRPWSPTSSKTTVGGKTQITYKAKLPVAWGKRNAMPDDATSSSCRSTSRPPARTRSPTKYGHDLRRLRRARRRRRLDVLLLPPARPRAATLAAADVVTVDRDRVAEPGRRPPASSPSTTRSGRTTRSTSSRSSASTRTARRRPRTPASPPTTSSSPR